MNNFFSNVVLVVLAITSGASAQHSEHSDLEEGRGHEDIIRIDPHVLKNLDLSSVAVRRGVLEQTCELSAEVVFAPHKIAHLTPRVPGIVTKVAVVQGDPVKKGQILAAMESRALGTANSEYLSALARQSLYKNIYEREMRLWERKISPEQDYLEAKNLWEESKIDTLAKRQALVVLGQSEQVTASLTSESPSTALTQYTFRAPFDGVVADLHITLGEYVSDDSTVFVVVDPSIVWVVGQVYERDLHRVRIGQKVAITFDAYPNQLVQGQLDYIGTSLNKETRSTEARVAIFNENGTLKEDMFARMTVFVTNETARIDSFLVPTSAVQRTKNGDTVYKIEGPGVFEQTPVVIIRKSKDFAEVAGELSDGDTIATGDTFVLKSEAEKGEMGEGHSH